MKLNRLLPVLVILLISGAGYLFWQNHSGGRPIISHNTRSTTRSEAGLPENTEGSSFIEQLRRRDFKGGTINIEGTRSRTDTYRSYLISYPSDDLTIYGVMNVPEGNGPFPVVILNHGYYNPSSFTSGDGTQTMADILAKNGYLTLASDYRGHGRSESDGIRGGHRPEYSIDVLSLIASVPSIKKADANNIGMWGHSMGGEVSMRAIEATDQVKAVVLWAPTSADASDNHGFYGGNRERKTTPDPETAGISPINYLHYITTSISIHQGTVDTEVNPEWSRELRDALKAKGKQVEHYEYEGQDHNFRNLGWGDVSSRTLAFYDRILQ